MTIMTININGKTIEYTIKKSNRRTISIEIKPGGRVIVKAPVTMKDEGIIYYVEAKREWILSHYEKAVAKEMEKVTYTPRERYLQRERALKLIPERVRYYNETFLHYKYGNITIKDTTSRWGSCSSRGNLNFCYRLVNAPTEVLDYVVVHELCHLKHFNHSKEFWDLVETVIPNYRKYRTWLKENGRNL